MEQRAHDMIAIPIETFVPGLQINVDVFIALSDEKFVMVFKAGSATDLERIREYREKSLKHLHIRKDDYPRFLERQLTVAGIVIHHPKVPGEHKLGFLHVAGELILKNYESMGFTGESFEAAKLVSKSIIYLVNAEPTLLKIVERLNQSSNYLLNHSMAVGLFATMLGRAMEWTRPETLEKLALGGLLHDIGLQEISPQLLTKHRYEMSYEEIREYESHAYRGMQILQSVSIVPADIVAIAYEHHENSIGQGYPRRLWDMKINPLARVVALADAFCEQIIISETNPKPKSLTEALLHIETVMGQPFNKDAFKKLKALVHETRPSASKAG